MSALQQLEGISFESKDFSAMIEHGKKIGWTQEIIEAHWKLKKGGKCFDFYQDAAPFLQGSIYEDNVFINYTGREHQESCQPFLESLAKKLKLVLVLN